jgi:hypothetical protein
MRRIWLIPLLAFSVCAYAGSTLRVGNQVLTVGDTATHAIELLGTPTYKEPVESTYGGFAGERWQFKRDDGHIIVVTIIGGKVNSIEDRVS